MSRNHVFLRAGSAAFFLHSAPAMMRGLVAALVTATAALLTAAGCNTSVVVDSGCPADKPVTGALCTPKGESCDYQDGPCQMTFACDAMEKTWKVETSTCVPAAVDCWSASEGDVCAIPGDSCGEGSGECGGGFESFCGDDHLWSVSYYEDEGCCYDECWNECAGWETCPSSPPAEGEGCYPYCPGTTSCSYPTNCGGVQATCGDDYQWHLIIGECPPPPMDPCSLQGTETECTNAGCRWLVPGCGTPSLPQAGCHAPTDCTPADCESLYSTCQQVVVDPCWNKACDACSMTVSLCLP
jgi:hypothetical protein